MKTTITRVTNETYAAKTDVLMSDGTYRADYSMRLKGNVLKSHEQRGHVRIDGLLKFTLGAKSFAAVTALGVGQEVTL